MSCKTTILRMERSSVSLQCRQGKTILRLLLSCSHILPMPVLFVTFNLDACRYQSNKLFFLYL